MAIAWVLSSQPGCLVSEPWSPPAELDVPPIIQPDPSNPLSPRVGHMVWLNTEDAPHEWVFAVTVISEDTMRPLEARWRIVKQGESMPTYMTLPPPVAGSRNRPVTINVTSSQLTLNECHRLDLAVSGSFVDLPGVDKRYLFDATETNRTQDIALATWWLLEGKGNAETLPQDKARILTSCNAVVNTPTSSASPGTVAPPEPQ